MAYGTAIFPESAKIFFRGQNLQENPRISAERVIFARFQAPNLKIQSPRKCMSIPQPFHTPTRLPPKLRSLAYLPPIRICDPVYSGPRMLTLASACWRDRQWTHVLTVLFWGHLCFMSPAGVCLRYVEKHKEASGRTAAPRLVLLEGA